MFLISMVSYQRGPTRHAYAWQIGPFLQDTIDIKMLSYQSKDSGYKDEAVWRHSYLSEGNPYTQKDDIFLLKQGHQSDICPIFVSAH